MDFNVIYVRTEDVYKNMMMYSMKNDFNSFFSRSRFMQYSL